MIKLMKNTFYNETETKRELCDFITRSDKLSMGQLCREFEEGFATYQERKHAVLYNSGSSANLALIQSLLNLGLLNREDNVGISVLTWATNVMPLIQLGLKPVPLDVSLKNLNVNSENLIGEYNLKSLFITNLLGFSGDIGKIREMCKDKKIILLEDNCESLGSRINGQKLGNFGLASTFSFFVGHHLSTIEGGMVCTDDEELYKMLVMTRAHGWGRNLDEASRKALKEKHGINDFYEKYAFYTLGYNLRPTEITGFLGVTQLKYLNEILRKRNENFLKYEEAASQNPDIERLDLSHMDFVSNFAYPLIFRDKKTFEEYQYKFSELEIRAIVGGCVTEQPFFKRKEYCPNAKRAHSLGFYIPNNPDLTEEEIELACGLLKGERYKPYSECVFKKISPKIIR